MENLRYGCINRDKNAVLNMEKIYDEFQRSGERPERYRRDVNLDLLSNNKRNQPFSQEVTRLSSGSMPTRVQLP
jgi:hypothetical protein